MEEKKLAEVKKKRADLAYQMETLIQDFTNKTNYLVERISVEYQNTKGLVPKDPSVRISIRLGVEESINKAQNSVAADAEEF